MTLEEWVKHIIDRPLKTDRLEVEGHGPRAHKANVVPNELMMNTKRSIPIQMSSHGTAKRSLPAQSVFPLQQHPDTLN